MKKLSIVLLAMLVVLTLAFAACDVDNAPKTYNVTFTAGDGYTFGGDRVVESGKDYTFTVKIADGYEKSAEFAVKANGKVLAEKDGKYTVSAVTENITVTVTGVVKKVAPIVKHSVTLPSGEGYTVTGATEVVDGESYTFTLAATTGFNIDNAVVKVNGEELDNNGNEGEYTVENVTADLVITVEGVARNSLEVTLTNGIGYKLDGEANATYGLPYTFEVVLGAAFKATDGFAVKANGTALTAEEDGKYKVANPTEALTITVEGVTIDESKKASFFYAPKNEENESYNANIAYDATTDTFTAKSVKNGNEYDVAIDPDVVAWHKAQGYKYLSLYYNNTNGNVSSLVMYSDAETPVYIAETFNNATLNGLVFAGRKYVSPGKSYLLLDLDNLYVGENGLYLCMRDGGEGQTVQFTAVKFSQTKPVEAEYISLFTFEAASVKSNIVGVEGGIAINMSGDQPVAISKAQIDQWIAEGKNTLSFRVKITENGEYVNNKNLWCDYPNALIAAGTPDYVATEGKVVTIDLTDSQYANGITFRADNIELTFYFTEIALTHTDYASVTLTEGTGYTLSGETRIVKGQAYAFKFALTEGYKQNASFAVKVNGEKVDVATDGTVTVAAGKVTGDLTVTVEGVEQIVVGNTLTTGDGFEYEVLDGANAVAIPYGGTLKFKVNLATGYSQSKFVVKDGEKVLEAVDGMPVFASYIDCVTVNVDNAIANDNAAKVDGKLLIDGEFGYRYSLKTPVDGISIEGNVVTVTDAFDVEFTIVATCVFDPTVTTEKTFTTVGVPSVNLQQVFDVDKSKETTVIVLDELDGKTVVEVKIGEFALTFTQEGKQLNIGGYADIAYGEGVVKIMTDKALYNANVLSAWFVDSVDEWNAEVTASQANPTDWNKYYVLAADLDYTGTKYVAPKGEQYGAVYGFKGTFDGRNHKIIGLTIRDTANSFFGTVAMTATIKNVAFTNCAFSYFDIDGTTFLSVNKSGIVADLLYGTLENVFVQGNLAGHWWCGGIAYFVGETATVKNCIVQADVISGDKCSTFFASADSKANLVGFYAVTTTESSTMMLVGADPSVGVAFEERDDVKTVASYDALKDCNFDDWDRSVWSLVNGYPQFVFA